MDTSQWSSVQRAFDQISILTGRQREQALLALQQEDEAVFVEVNELLKQESNMHSIFGQNPFGDYNFFEDEGLVNSKIGPYRLTELLGYGGMGSVFLAKRIDQEFEQEVAMKLVRPRKYSEATILRFKEERQILANLNHASIATLYDGGSMEDGRMYFTMEYLPWPNLEDYIQENNLDLSARLALFKKIASGIAYAHSQMVLHLDIKPKNILVSPEGDPKILDFGISQRFFTDKEKIDVETELVPSDNRYTMAFASPEQLNKKQLSTQSDIYGLGGLLYYLISDNLPFGKNDTTREAYFDNVMSGKFIAPSMAVADEKLSGKLSGDLDAICKHALELKPTDRYASVDHMIRDIRAHETEYPVSVREQENMYRFLRFVKRNRAAISLLSIFLLSIIALTTYYTQSLAKQRNIALYETQKSQQLLSFMTGIFSNANPYENQGDTVSVGNYLERSLPGLETQFTQQEDTKVELLLTLGQVYNGLNNYSKGDSLLGLAYQVVSNNASLPDSLLARSIYEYATSQHDIGMYDASNALVLKVDSLYNLNSDSKSPYWNPLGKGRLYSLMGNNFDQRGMFIEADSFFQMAYQMIADNVKSPDQELADILLLMGSCQRHMGNYDEAEKYYKQCLEMQNTLHDPPNSEIAITLNHFASLHFNKGEYDKAITYGEESLSQRKKIFGLMHRETMASASNLARNYLSKKDYPNALKRYLEIIDILKHIYPGPHPYHASIYSTIANLYRNTKNYKEAVRYFDLADLVVLKIGRDNPQSRLAVLGGKGLLYLETKQFSLAESYLQQQLELGKTVYPADHPSVGKYSFMLGKCYFEKGEKAKAIPYLDQAKLAMSKVPDKYLDEKVILESMLKEVNALR